MKLVFVLLDGLNWESSVHMSYLAAHKENGAICGVMNCELPTLSKPIYSTFFTGQNPLMNHITHNKNNFLDVESYNNSFFEKMRKQKSSCALAAYYWMRELYTRQEFIPERHRLTLEKNGVIPYGIFYNDDYYLDKFVFQDAQALRSCFNPDFLLVHTMGIDTAGHDFGSKSLEYRHAVRNADMLLAEHVPSWIDDEALVIITSDHGMHEDGAHNDTSPNVRQVPYWILGNASEQIKIPQKQTDWYKLLCTYFDLK